MDESKPRRRWLSFGIRDLLWAMIVVAFALGWLIHYRELSTELKKARQSERLMRFNGWDEPSYSH